MKYLHLGTQSESGDENIDNHVQRINEMIKEQKYREAVLLLKVADARAGNADER